MRSIQYNNNNNINYCQLISWYILFGALHELFHVAAAASFRLWTSGVAVAAPTAAPTSGNGEQHYYLSVVLSKVYQVVLGRCVALQVDTPRAEEFVRHAGWIGSGMVVLCLYYYYYSYCASFMYKTNGRNNQNCSTRPSSSSFKACRTAALLTALEAVWTDLLRGAVVNMPFWSGTATAGTTTFFCGNFGLILLHQAWFADRQGQTSALDVLEKMIQVTMMRGAQSGGVVSFFPKRTTTTQKTTSETGGLQQQQQLQAIRTRVVNRKRTDLSQWLRQKVQRDHQGSLLGESALCSLRQPTQNEALFYSGHTRFATSSKASMEGTHPQRWTPPTKRMVYRDWTSTTGLSEETGGDSVAAMAPVKPQVMAVENYVTHNGDFDFYQMQSTVGMVDVEALQQWLIQVTQSPMPAVVDSCAVAGMVDVLRTQGCFALSARYACSLGMETISRLVWDGKLAFPTYKEFEKIGAVFEDVLAAMSSSSLPKMDNSTEHRISFAQRVASKLVARRETLIPAPLRAYILSVDDDSSSTIMAFCLCTIHAFFDNDLFWATKTFLLNAKGSFGLCVTSSLDSHRQLCLAARGQTMSIAFYPRKGMICYGSEAAAVKAGMSIAFPGDQDSLGKSRGDVDNDVLRLDLDDLGGEVVLLDWESRLRKTSSAPPVSLPNRHLIVHDFMNGAVQGILHQESKATTQDPQIYHRMTRLSRNRFIKPLPGESVDPVLKDIQDIPTICKAIQDEWHSDNACTSLNRLTAYNLSRCLRTKLEAHVTGTVSSRAVDILLTGCEVSLWLAEQFASDLQKAFPGLRVMAVSSNKLLGLYGQEISVPALGFPYSPKSYDLHDTIVIVVSHSGGTFAPLSCSNLFQSTTKNLFVITSEWDTQIAKQLRRMDVNEDECDLFASRIFSTEVGIRPAEPSSVSVAATHQLLTNLFEYISVVVLSDQRFRRASGATISEQDLKVLERCNRDNIDALEEIVGISDKKDIVANRLRAAGDVWSEHILENAKAYILTCLYIFATVISGYPLAFAVAHGAGLDTSNDWIYLIRALDAAIYFWLPQINVTLLRVIQRRNLKHRMVGRTVVIGDIPWVAQAAEAFLSKIFACSYSIAGLNVLSGNPSDHFVHRHTHRVVRGSLVICGRPDGRLSALATAEAAVCLSVNQASSIQSFGGTCESLTIGHNPFELPLSAKGIFLKRKRPLFLCERMLVEADVAVESAAKEEDVAAHQQNTSFTSEIFNALNLKAAWRRRRASPDMVDLSLHRDSSVNPRVHKKRSATALLGAYMNFGDDSSAPEDVPVNDLSVDEVVESAILEQKWSDRARNLFRAFDTNGDGFLSEEEFIEGSYRLQAGLVGEELLTLFRMADSNESGRIGYNEFLTMYAELEVGIKLPPTHRNERGLIQVEPSSEKFFGELTRQCNAGKCGKDVDFMVARSQENAMLLYETRIASLQRFVSMTVMFHQMGLRVQTFFSSMSFGIFGYRMDRTHSIMRIATTASPVSGADVRERMRQLLLLKKIRHSIHVISQAYLVYKSKEGNPGNERLADAAKQDEQNTQERSSQ